MFGFAHFFIIIFFSCSYVQFSLNIVKKNKLFIFTVFAFPLLDSSAVAPLLSFFSPVDIYDFFFPPFYHLCFSAFFDVLCVS